MNRYRVSWRDTNNRRHNGIWYAANIHDLMLTLQTMPVSLATATIIDKIVY